LNELGLKEINNCAFVMSTVDNLKKILLISDYVGYG
jgi:ribosomal protein L30/L7E